MLWMSRLRSCDSARQSAKSLQLCEGVVQNIDPDSSFADYLQPMVRKLIYQAFAGPDLLGRLRDSVADAAEISIALPRRIDRVLGEIEQAICGSGHAWKISSL